MWKSISRKKSGTSHWETLSLVLPRNVIVSQHLIIQFSLYYLSSGRLWGVKNKRQFQTFSLSNWQPSLARGGGLQEVLNIVIWLGNFWRLGKLVTKERWSLKRSGCNWRFNCIPVNLDPTIFRRGGSLLSQLISSHNFLTLLLGGPYFRGDYFLRG